MDRSETVRIRFELEQEPVAKGRPRLGMGRVHTPSKTILYENIVAIEYRRRFTGLTLEGPVKLTVYLGYEPPRSYSEKKRREMIGKLRDKKPDADNLVKSIMDGLQKGGAYKDDGQVAILNVVKYYAESYSVKIALEEMKRDVIIDLGEWETWEKG